ncbi:MAG TPA: hypothetical protein VHA75_02580 [Rugosimonospora sp.]|nr:hypothetical protein [Rugosimonospora sp.]
MFAPDDEGKPFIARWNMLVRILLVESSVKHVARAAMDYADFDDGSSCHPSNERLARETGLNERTVRFAWAAMRGMGMAERVAHGVAYQRLADEYQLTVPDSWRGLPTLGPFGQKFTCLGCGKRFNPQGNCAVSEYPDDKPDTIRFNLARMCFCPAPRKTNGRDGTSCQTVWNQRQAASGAQPWGPHQDKWKLFREARGDDW